MRSIRSIAILGLLVAVSACAAGRDDDGDFVIGTISPDPVSSKF